MWEPILMFLLFTTALFLILLVLVQRGRGGGLAGAFGGLGGQSAFGTKAGDLFTRITIFTAAFWIILCAVAVKALNERNSGVINLGNSGANAPEATGKKSASPESAKGATGGKATPPASQDKAAPAAAGGQSEQKSDAAPADGGAASDKAKSDDTAK